MALTVISYQKSHVDTRKKYPNLNKLLQQQLKQVTSDQKIETIQLFLRMILKDKRKIQLYQPTAQRLAFYKRTTNSGRSNIPWTNGVSHYRVNQGARCFTGPFKNRINLAHIQTSNEQNRSMQYFRSLNFR